MPLMFGTVSEVDAPKCRVRVKFGEDELTSYWLPVVQRFTQDNKSYHLPAQGEQLACLMENNMTRGVVLGALYNSEDTPAMYGKNIVGVKFKDGGKDIKNVKTGDFTSTHQGYSFKRTKLGAVLSSLSEPLQALSLLKSGVVNLGSKLGKLMLDPTGLISLGSLKNPLQCLKMLPSGLTSLAGTAGSLLLDPSGLASLTNKFGAGIGLSELGKLLLVAPAGISMRKSMDGADQPWELEELKVKRLIVTESSQLASASADALGVSGAASVTLTLEVGGTLYAEGGCVGCTENSGGSGG